AFLEGYLEIEQLRFGDRLRVQIEVPKPLMEAQVPTFVLQPLVENAIKHGLSSRATGGAIQIRARQDGQRLFLEVEDDGTGTPGTQRGTGIGTQNTRSRLAQLYGEAQSFNLVFPTAGGALAQISLPLSLSKTQPILQGSLP
ncbi:MAG: sensor histidine kinase, partial [Rhodospirillales bacterium]